MAAKTAPAEMEEVPEMPSAKQQAWLENQMTQDQKDFFAENGELRPVALSGSYAVDIMGCCARATLTLAYLSFLRCQRCATLTLESCAQAIF